MDNNHYKKNITSSSSPGQCFSFHFSITFKKWWKWCMLIVTLSGPLLSAAVTCHRLQRWIWSDTTDRVASFIYVSRNEIVQCILPCNLFFSHLLYIMNTPSRWVNKSFHWINPQFIRTVPSWWTAGHCQFSASPGKAARDDLVHPFLHKEIPLHSPGSKIVILQGWLVFKTAWKYGQGKGKGIAVLLSARYYSRYFPEVA